MDIENVCHENGVPWYEAKEPWWIHRCRRHTRAMVNGDPFGRCACGATYLMGGWCGKNENRWHRLRDRFGRG